MNSKLKRKDIGNAKMSFITNGNITWKKDRSGEF